MTEVKRIVKAGGIVTKRIPGTARPDTATRIASGKKSARGPRRKREKRIELELLPQGQPPHKTLIPSSVKRGIVNGSSRKHSVLRA